MLFHRLGNSTVSRSSYTSSTSQSVKASVVEQRTFTSSSSRSKERLVILGSGWGGYEVLRGVDRSRWDVTMISPRTYFNFTPLLPSCAVGSLEYRCVMEPVRRYSPEATTYQAWCNSIDFKGKTLKCMPATPPLPSEKSSAPKADATRTQYPGTGTPFDVPYDKLVIAVGVYPQTFGIPGVKEHGLFLTEVKDARAVRTRILECFERASQPFVSEEDCRDLLHFCVVGAGPTGVEISAELHDLLQGTLKKHFPTVAPFAKISLYDVAPTILGTAFDQSLKKHAENMFRREGINVLTNHHVEKVEDSKMYVKEQGEVPFGMLLWNTGLAPNPFIESIVEAEKHPKTGSVITNDHLNLLMKSPEGGPPTPNPDVWAIGDAAMIQGLMLPATAQVANQEAKYLVKKLNGIVRNRDVSNSFKFKNLGTLAYLGEEQGLYDRSSADGLKGNLAGRLAWLLWRSAYISMSLSLRNKILVATYLFLNWVFGRDLSRF